MKKLFLLSMISGMALFGCQTIIPIPTSQVSRTNPTITPSGASKHVAIATLPLVERWKWSGMMPGLDYPPLVVVATEKVVIVAQDGKGSKIITFDAHTGNPVWESDYIRHLHTVDVSDNHVYVGTMRYIQAFALETGQVLWQGAEQPWDKKGFLDVYVTDNKQVQVYDFQQAHLYLLDPETGATLEEGDYPQIFFKKGNTYYSGCRYGYQTSCLAAINITTDQILWSRRFKGLIHLWPTFIEDQTLLINSGGQLFAINNATGEIIWQSQGLHFVTGPVKQDNLIYAIRSDATIVAFNPETGEEAGIIEMAPNRTIEDNQGALLHYAIAASDKFVAAYYGNSQELIVFERVNNTGK